MVLKCVQALAFLSSRLISKICLTIILSWVLISKVILQLWVIRQRLMRFYPFKIASAIKQSLDSLSHGAAEQSGQSTEREEILAF